MHNIKLAGFTCISLLFLQVNEFNRYIDMISKPSLDDEEKNEEKDGSNNVIIGYESPKKFITTSDTGN